MAILTFVAYVDSANSIATPSGPVYVVPAPFPPVPGVYDFQMSADAGVTWTVLNRIHFNDPANPPYVNITVNPAIHAPYVWYRFYPIEIVAPDQSGSNQASVVL